MARQIRKKSGTGIYHIMLRGIPLDYRGQVIGRFGKSMTCPPDLLYLLKIVRYNKTFVIFVLETPHGVRITKNDMAKIIVQNTEITVLSQDEKDYISLIDMANGKHDECHAPNSKVVEFDHFRYYYTLINL